MEVYVPEDNPNTILDSPAAPAVEAPKPGVETSSFKIAVISAIAPVALLLVIVLGLIFIKDEAVRSILIDALKYMVSAGILAGGAVGWKYVEKRGDVSVAKVNALGSLISALRSSNRNQQS